MGKAKRSLLFFAAFVLSIGLAFQALPAYAMESYGGHVPPGVEDFMSGALPPAGTNIYLNYLGYVSSSQMNGNGGGKAWAAVAGKSASLNTSVDVLINVFRFCRVTKIKALGGDVIWHVIVPVSYAHVSNQVNLPAFIGGGTVYGGGFPTTTTSVGDIEFGSGIAWHFGPTLHMAGGVDFVAPTGSYQAWNGFNPTIGGSSGASSRNFTAAAAYAGHNYWSIDPLLCVTYLGDKNSALPGFEVSAKMMYWFNTVNTATSYVSGQEVAADYLVGYHPNKQWAFGANGNIIYQTTRDKQYGQTAYDPLTGLQTGLPQREWSIGPAVTYEIPHGCLTFKWQHDIMAANMPQQDRFWLRWIYAW